MSEREKTVQELLNAAVEDETLRGWRLIGEAADTIGRLTRERDEALEQVTYQYNRAEALENERDDAEAAGYRRGVRDAADKVQSMRTSTTADAARAILALLEQTGEKK